MKIRSFFITLLFVASAAFAQEPSKKTASSEFNFSNQEIEHGWAARKQTSTDLAAQAPTHPDHLENQYAKRLADWLREHCAECTIEEHIGKFDVIEYDVSFSNGWGFNISVDPAVVEIQTRHAVPSQLKENLGRMRRYIFEAANSCGLKTRLPTLNKELTAHLNFGIRASFADQPPALARFIADYSNRPELALGLLGKEVDTAPLMISLSYKQQDEFQKFLDLVNRGKLKTIEEIGGYMNRKVYTESPSFIKGDHEDAIHNQAIGLKNIENPEFKKMDLPFEMRAIRQPQTAEEFLLLVDLIDKRIDYLKKQSGPIQFWAKNLQSYRNAELSSLQQAAHFQIYVEEMGEHWTKYEALLRPEHVKELKSGAVEKILTGNIDWADESEFENFRRILSDRYYLSEFTEKRVQNILSKKSIPKEQLQTLVDDFVRLAQENPLHAKQVHAFTQSIPSIKEWNPRPTSCNRSVLQKIFGFISSSRPN